MCTCPELTTDPRHEAPGPKRPRQDRTTFSLLRVSHLCHVSTVLRLPFFLYIYRNPMYVERRAQRFRQRGGGGTGNESETNRNPETHMIKNVEYRNEMDKNVHRKAFSCLFVVRGKNLCAQRKWRRSAAFPQRRGQRPGEATRRRCCRGSNILISPLLRVRHSVRGAVPTRDFRCTRLRPVIAYKAGAAALYKRLRPKFRALRPAHARGVLDVHVAASERRELGRERPGQRAARLAVRGVKVFFLFF